MMIEKASPRRLQVGRLIRVMALLAASNATCSAIAEDWGAYMIVPASAPALVLEAVGSGTDEGTVVSIGKPAGTANQKWIIEIVAVVGSCSRDSATALQLTTGTGSVTY